MSFWFVFLKQIKAYEFRRGAGENEVTVIFWFYFTIVPETRPLTDFTLEELKEPVEKCQNTRALFNNYKVNETDLSSLFF